MTITELFDRLDDAVEALERIAAALEALARHFANVSYT